VERHESFQNISAGPLTHGLNGSLPLRVIGAGKPGSFGGTVKELMPPRFSPPAELMAQLLVELLVKREAGTTILLPACLG
jgi:hypothetical protein